MKIAIVDDLEEDRRLLQTYLNRWSKEHPTLPAPPPAMFDNAAAMLENLAGASYDIIFLDIYMEGLCGMEAARRIRSQNQACRIVFTTSTPDFAAQSYDVEASYYLVKPIDYPHFSNAMARCCATMAQEQLTITVPGSFGNEEIYLQDIVYTEYVNRRVALHLKSGGTRYVSMKQTDFANALLSHSCFCDCMKGVLVNLDMIEQLEKDRFLLKDGTYIPISRLKYQNVREQFLKYSYARMRGTPND